MRGVPSVAYQTIEKCPAVATMLALATDRVVATRGEHIRPLGMFPYVSVNERIPTHHTIRKLRVLVDSIRMDGRLASISPTGTVSVLVNALMGNWHCLLVGVDIRHAKGAGECDGALRLISRARRHHMVMTKQRGI